MYMYRVISDISSVPEMTDLEAAYIEQPSRRECGLISFSRNYQLNPMMPYQLAVGVRCRVIRTSGERSQECGGAVKSITPVRVVLDGEGWH